MSPLARDETVTGELEHYSNVSYHLWNSFQHFFSSLIKILVVLKRVLAEQARPLSHMNKKHIFYGN